MARKEIGNSESNALPSNDCTESQRIGWDHPLVTKFGICPGYLLQERLGYSDSYWPKFLSEHHFLWKQMNRQPWFSLPAFERYLGTPIPIPQEE